MEPIRMHYEVDGTDFIAAGSASVELKKVLKNIGLPAESIRRATICMYEGELNMVLHADGGTADIAISGDQVEIVLSDRGPGIPDIELAMKEGWSTASDNVRNLGFGAGMGLPNMRSNADDMEVRSEVGVGTTITMKINI